MTLGYLVEGKFTCPQCVSKLNLGAGEPTPLVVTSANIGPLYSQRCDRCRRQVVAGRSRTELFPISDDPDEFRWTDMMQLLVKFDMAITDDDREAAEGARLTMYERILRALAARKLQDQEMVLDAVQRVIRTVLRW